MRICDLYARSTPTISFEFFPPRTPEAEATLFRETVPALKTLGPSFCSVTWGAGGSTHETTLRVVQHLRTQEGLMAMPHLTCAGATRANITAVLDQAHAMGIDNLLTLRGDPPKGQTTFIPQADGFAHALDLIRFVKENGKFGIGAACYPEGHVECANKHADWDWAAAKVEAGAEFLITQLFYDWSDFLDMEDYLRHKKNIKVPIIPGVLPFLSTEQIHRFTALCGSKLPGPLRRKLEEHAKDDEAVRKVGVEVCTDICRKLLDHGVAGIHFYCLNRVASCRDIINNLGLANER